MNTWFQFKQFTVHQEKTAMKVCTDACLFGAWVANKIELKEINADNILDIGCGTGLLSLMLAQKTKAQIDAVEIDKNAFEQAKENINLTEWKEQINIHHGSIIDFKSTKKYDLIICNPPFYENQLKSVDAARNTAMHATTLSYKDLIISVKNNLAQGGSVAVLLPYYAIIEFEEALLNHQLFIYEKCNVSHSPKHPYFRNMVIFSQVKKVSSEDSILIKNINNFYSEEFIELLKDYYLNF